ncbi:hypothetical protein CCHR01_12828 [Colletotrichum chrysophilum]|uniref:Uncharacterized protein n=1 Tax=Colletotrichum chrysophilum TaxID=1836956 RepID=A0AAD9EDR5_9PEZI|nr:hypothetical protein CCHR01_12828 [Colletotrichum chrysophilum]
MDPKPAMPSQIRPGVRHRGVLLAAIAVSTAIVGIRYQANSRRTNELNQRTTAPYYVTVDRSGGGI